jgi:hypothetical protein
MPRPLWKPIVFALCLAALPPATLHAALAAAAGTLFEAAPFVLVAEAAAGSRFRWFGAAAALAGCGCGSRFPGALSLPATALAWLAFGPVVALGRFGIALGLGFVARRGQHTCGVHTSAGRDERPDVFAELTALALAAGTASLAVTLLRDASVALRAWGGTGTVLAFGAGLLLGRVVPCATAGVAVAAALAATLPAGAAGLLASAGIVRRATPGGRPAVDASGIPLAGLALALVLAGLAAAGPSGMVNPRLVPVAGASAVLAALRCRTRASRVRGALLVPGLMAGALVLHVPEPAYRLDATEAAAAFPGSHLAFSGVALPARGTTVVERFAIACCRLDATPIVVTLERRLPVTNAWVTVEGTIVRDGGANCVLRVSRWRRQARPADPFLYR